MHMCVGMRFVSVPGLVRMLVMLVINMPVRVHFRREFMPPLDEGDLLCMPSALPGIAAGKVRANSIAADKRTLDDAARLMAFVVQAAGATAATSGHWPVDARHFQHHDPTTMSVRP